MTTLTGLDLTVDAAPGKIASLGKTPQAARPTRTEQGWHRETTTEREGEMARTKAPKATAKWMKKLNAAELKHLAECSDSGRPTLRSLKANREHQKASGFDCIDCRIIARKMGLEG